MNYNTFMKLGNRNLQSLRQMGVIGITTCKIQLGKDMIKQDFIVCTYLKQNLILGIDFACQNCASIEWTKEGTRILTLRGKNIIEVKEDDGRSLWSLNSQGLRYG